MPGWRQEGTQGPSLPRGAADPLVCPKYQGPKRVIALIEDPAVVRAILTHLGLWQPQALERAPPAPARARCVITSIAQRSNPPVECS